MTLEEAVRKLKLVQVEIALDDETTDDFKHWIDPKCRKRQSYYIRREVKRYEVPDFSIHYVSTDDGRDFYLDGVGINNTNSRKITFDETSLILGKDDWVVVDDYGGIVK